MESLTQRVPPTVVHVNRHPFDVYIGRAWAGHPESKWHNPFRLKDKNDPVERNGVADKYEMYVRLRPDLIAALHELEGKVLGCWCRPKYPCHGDVLAKLFQEFVR
jgi:hypothetical protein